MLLAVNEIKRNKLKFSLITLILALIVFLLILLSAMGNGLIQGLAGAFNNINADLFIFAQDSNLNVQRSNIPEKTLKDISGAVGADSATPLKFSIASAKIKNENVDIALLGIEDSAVTRPAVTEGRFKITDLSAVVDVSLLDKGVKIGDRIKIKKTDLSLTIAGVTTNNKLSMMPGVFVSTNTWNEINKAALSKESPGQLLNFSGSNLIMVKAPANTEPLLLQKELENKFPEIKAATKKEAVDAYQGMGPMAMVVRALQVFSFTIGIAVTGVFFYIITIQKTSHFGAIKAIGATNGYLLTEMIKQVTIITIVGAAAGVLLALLSMSFIPPAISMTPTVSGIIYSTIGVYLMSLAGSIFSARHIFKIDPGIALGQAQ